MIEHVDVRVLSESRLSSWVGISVPIFRMARRLKVSRPRFPHLWLLNATVSLPDFEFFRSVRVRSPPSGAAARLDRPAAAGAHTPSQDVEGSTRPAAKMSARVVPEVSPKAAQGPSLA